MHKFIGHFGFWNRGDWAQYRATGAPGVRSGALGPPARVSEARNLPPVIRGKPCAGVPLDQLTRTRSSRILDPGSMDPWRHGSLAPRILGHWIHGSEACRSREGPVDPKSLWIQNACGFKAIRVQRYTGTRAQGYKEQALCPTCRRPRGRRIYILHEMINYILFVYLL